jgi:hypothetical protein
MTDMINANKASVRKPERKRPLEKARRRWESNIKVYRNVLRRNGDSHVERSVLAPLGPHHI